MVTILLSLLLTCRSTTTTACDLDKRTSFGAFTTTFPQRLHQNRCVHMPFFTFRTPTTVIRRVFVFPFFFFVFFFFKFFAVFLIACPVRGLHHPKPSCKLFLVVGLMAGCRLRKRIPRHQS